MPIFLRLCFVLVLVSVISVLIESNDLKTTVIILNWSRLANVNKIVSGICTDLLEDTVHSIIVWNNNPKPLTYERDFPHTPCPENRLMIINSPENRYFEARFVACAKATTLYCFIQDDDYLIKSSIIRALASRIDSTSIPAIHLQPSHEMLTSELRTLAINERIHTTFAWLGYGTIIKRSLAVNFLSLLDALDLSDAEHKMADNYFTILGNRVPERWFEPGIELGGGQPFTVGTEGDERNNRHILRAAWLLDNIVSENLKGDFPYVFPALLADLSYPARAPCHYNICLFETSIKLLPDDLFVSSSSEDATAADILTVEKTRLSKLGDDKKWLYITFPPSNAVDGLPETAFRSPENAKDGDWISLDFLKLTRFATLAILVDSSTQQILLETKLQQSADGITWTTANNNLSCTPESRLASEAQDLSLCKAVIDGRSTRLIRFLLERNLDRKWCIYEISVDNS